MSPEQFRAYMVSIALTALALAVLAVTFGPTVHAVIWPAPPSSYSYLWTGPLHGVLTHCTMTVDSTGNGSLNDCWR